MMYATERIFSHGTTEIAMNIIRIAVFVVGCKSFIAHGLNAEMHSVHPVLCSVEPVLEWFRQLWFCNPN